MGYVTQSPDTNEVIERLQFDRLRQIGRQKRLENGLARIGEALPILQHALRKAHPDWTPEQLQVEWVRTQFGEELSQKVAEYLQCNRTRPINSPFGTLCEPSRSSSKPTP